MVSLMRGSYPKVRIPEMEYLFYRRLSPGDSLEILSLRLLCALASRDPPRKENPTLKPHPMRTYAQDLIDRTRDGSSPRFRVQISDI